TSKIIDSGQSALNTLQQDIQSIIPGTLSQPLLSDPLSDLKALLLGENVVLIQYQFPGFNIQPVGITIGPFPIVPPLEMGLQFGFGVKGDLTLGYDTAGLSADFTPTKDETAIYAPDPISEGIFVTEPSDLLLTGFIGLILEANLGIAQVGGEGKLI